MVTPLLPHPRAVGAGALVMYRQLRELAARHEVALATFAGPDPLERDAVEGLRREGLEVHAVWRPGWRGIGRWRRRLRLAWRWSRGSAPLRTLLFQEEEMQRLLDRLLAGERFDLLQVEDNAMAAYRFRTRAPAVLTEHEVRALASSNSSSGRLPRSPDERRWGPYQAAAWRRFDRIQVFTPQDATVAAAIAPDLADRIQTNPFGVDPLPPADLSCEAPGETVFVGGFRHPPNVEGALWLGREIFPRLQARFPGARLTLVGDHPPAAVQALRGRGIEVTGRVPAVEPFLERAAVVLAPLRTGGGLRMKVLQAMAMGKAVVATPLAAEGIAAPGGEPALALAGDAEGFAARTAALLADPAERAALGRRARAVVTEHHGWAGYAERLEALYAELLPTAGVA
jgi:polysaccharide biosynthesis protein PslH